MRRELQELEKLVKKYGSKSEYDDPSRQLATGITKLHTGYSVVDAGYINDVKDIVKLFFQDQNHIRITAGETTFVGLLRRESLVGSTIEELLFAYGSKQKLAFTALFYVADFGREEEMRLEEVSARFQSLSGQPFSFTLLQDVIRQIGSAVLEFAEELRRPIGASAAFVVPLAIYREVGDATGIPSA